MDNRPTKWFPLKSRLVKQWAHWDYSQKHGRLRWISLKGSPQHGWRQTTATSLKFCPIGQEALLKNLLSCGCFLFLLHPLGEHPVNLKTFWTSFFRVVRLFFLKQFSKKTHIIVSLRCFSKFYSFYVYWCLLCMSMYWPGGVRFAGTTVTNSLWTTI